MRHITPDQIEASRRKADKYLLPPGADRTKTPRAIPMNDDMRSIARFLFGSPMASVCGNVERSQAIDALARLAGVKYDDLAKEFDARRIATAAAHELVHEKHALASKRPTRSRR